MSALARSEWLKLRTTRSVFGLTLALVLLVALATAGLVGASDENGLGTADFRGDVVFAAGTASLFTLLLGILLVTGEYRHGTIAPTFLVTPVRERVIGAKALVGMLAGVVLGAIAIVLALAIAVPWVSARGASFELGDAELWKRVLGVLLAAALSGALGVAVGALVHNQLAAVVGALAWFFVAEPLVGGAFSLLGAPGVGRYLPGSATNALMEWGEGHLLAGWAALVVTTGYVLVFGTLGLLRTARRDVT